jgi:hypothetical protein
MKSKRLICIIILVFILLACKNSSYDIKEIDLVGAFDNKNKINLSTIAESVEYIPLQSNRSHYIEKIPRVYADSKYIIIIAFKQQIVFDRSSGEFICKVGHYGRDPGAFRRTRFNIAFNEDRKTIYADSWEGNIIEYSLNNKIVNVFERPQNVRSIPSFAWVNDSIYYAYVENRTGDEKVRLVRFNSNNDSIWFIANNNFYKNDPNFARSWGAGMGWFYRYNKQLFLKELFVDTVYSVKTNGLFPRYIMNCGNYAPPSFKREFIKSDDFKSYFWIQRMFESTNFVFFKLSYQESTRYGVYNKIEDSTHITHYSEITSLDSNVAIHGFVNDLDGFHQFCPESINSRGEMIALLQAYEIVNWFNENPDKATKLPSHLQKLKSIRETDNPVVMIVKLKG